MSVDLNAATRAGEVRPGDSQPATGPAVARARALARGAARTFMLVALLLGGVVLALGTLHLRDLREAELDRLALAAELLAARLAPTVATAAGEEPRLDRHALGALVSRPGVTLELIDPAAVAPTDARGSTHLATIAGSPWSLRATLATSALAATLLDQMLPFIAVAGLLLAGLGFGYRQLRRTMIAPALDFAAHVAAARSGQPRPVAGLPPLWRAWVDAVDEAFTARRELAAENARFRTAAESLLDGLAIWDSDDRLVYCNSRYPEHLTPALRAGLALGRRFEEWIREGVAAEGVYHEGMGGEFVERRLALRRQPSSDHEHQLVDGRWMRIRESKMPDGGTVLLTSDITQRRLQREALAEQTRKLEAVLANMADGVTLLDPDGTCVLANDGFLRMYGFGPDFARPGVPVAEFTRERLRRGDLRRGEDPAAVARDAEAVVQARAEVLKRTPSVEFEETRPDGRIVRVRRQRLPDGLLVSTYSDVTEAHRHERQLAVLATAVEQAGDAIEIADAGLRLVYVNPAFEQLTGWTAAEAVGRTPLDLLGGDEDPARQAELEAALRSGSSWAGRLVGRHRDGRRLVQDVTISPLRDASGALTHFVAVKRDVGEKERAEAALRASERAKQIVLEAALDCVIGMDDEGRIVEFNPAAERTFGHRRDAVIGRDLAELIIPERHRAGHRAGLARHRATGKPRVLGRRIEMPALHASGHELPVELVVVAAPEADRGGYLAYLRDISEQKRAEQALRESEARYRGVVEAQTEFILRQRPDGTLTFVNDAYCRQVGRTRDEILDPSWNDLALLVPAEREALLALWATLTPDAPTASIELHPRLPDGRAPVELWIERALFDDQGNIVEIQSVGRDITEQRAAEHALRASEERFRTIVEDQLEFITRIDPDHRLTFVNQAYARHLGRARDSLIGTSVLDLMTPEQQARFKAQLAVLTPEAPTFTYEMSGTAADGSKRIEQWTDRALFDAAGRLLEYQSVGRDITDQKIAEQELRARQQQYQAVIQDQTEVIGRFDADLKLTFANAAHCRMLGRPIEELIGQDYFASVPAELEPDLRRRLAALTPESPVDYGENEKVLPDGRARWFAWTNRALFDGRGVLVGYQSVGRDITEQKQAEDALRESEAAMRAIAEGVPVPLAIARLDRPEILFLNERAIEVFALGLGWQKAAIERVWCDLADRERMLALVAERGRVDGLETRLRRVDGSEAWILFSARLITYAGDRAFLAVMTDITERRTMEQALRSSEARLAAFLANAPVGMYLKDLGGRYVLANPEMSKIFGRPAAEMIGRSADDTAGGHDLQAVSRADAEVLRTGAPVIVEEHAPQLEAYRWSLVFRFPLRQPDGRITHIGGFHVDTTEAKRAEQALRDSEQRFRRFAEDHPVPLVVLRLPDTRVLFVSPAYVALFQHSAAELDRLDKHALWANPDDRAPYLEQLVRDGEVREREVMLRRKDGSTFPALMSSRLMEYGGAPAVVTSVLDLSRQKAAEAEIERQREILHQSEKLAALGGLLAGVAHELNNPLSVVVGYSSMLEELSQDEGTRRRAQRVHAAAERCARIVKSFLAMARQRPPQFAAVDMNAVIEAALELAAYGLRTADIEVLRSLDPSLPEVWGDADQLHQVLTNLIVNAQQALQERSTGPRRILVRTRVRRGAVEVTVGDNGPGMPPEVRARIFEPFYSTKPTGVGTGVGLSLCHALVAAHGGHIEVFTSQGKGSRFKITLPTMPNGTRPAPSAPAPMPTASRGRVLVVDDEAEIADLVKEVLGREGYQVTVARSGREALERIRAEAIDVVVSDLRMPDLDGPSLWRELSATRPDLAARMLFLTGDTLSGTARAFLHEADAPVLDKPLDLDELRRRVADLAGSGTGADQSRACTGSPRM